MSLLSMCVGINQEKRWAELALEPPKPKKEKDEIKFIELTISPEVQALMDYFDWVKSYSSQLNTK